jgi:hypothetical protein
LFYQRIATAALAGDLLDMTNGALRELQRTPRWRWLRRIHLERQVLLLNLAFECYKTGWNKGVRSTVHGA